MLIRLQKYLADAGVASRRKSEEIILQGRVRVNGSVVDSLGTKVDCNDVVCVDGVRVSINSDMIYIMLNKPLGCVSTANDQFNRKTVLDCVDVKERIYPVGRLDYDTSGLILLTNDGELTNKLTHPKHNIDKNYIAVVKGVPSDNDLQRFRNGINIDGRMTAPAQIKIINTNGKTSTLDIKIHEGRNRQVRKMCEAINTPVIKLKRIAIGDIKLGELKIGEYRYLSDDEINYLKQIK